MSIVHSFVSAKSDGADATLVRPSDWNANHTFTGVTRNYITTAGTTGFSIYHNLNDLNASLIGWSATWPTNVQVVTIGLTNMDVMFSTPSFTNTDIFISNIEVIP